ncbi:MAG: hypothetical protein RL557_295 [archaeon]
MAIYSHSRLSTFEQCQLKYKFKYIDGLTPDYENTIEAFLGKKVHETLEWLYRTKKSRSVVLDDAIAFFIEAWRRDFNETIKIVKNSTTSEDYFNKGIRFLINYFMKNYPFNDNTIAIEQKIFINVDEQGEHKLIGFIDRLVHHTDSNIFEIHDYKTGSIKNQEELDRDRQLALYSLGVREMFSEARDVHLVWHFLDQGEKKISKRTIEQLQLLRADIKQLIQKIEQEHEFRPHPGILCKWCEFRSYCPIIKENPNFPDALTKIKIDER